MADFYNSILSLGINNSLKSNSEIKKIKLFNRFCYCWYCTTVILFICYLSKNPILYLNLKIHFFQLIVILIAHTLHTKGYYETGRLLYILMIIETGFLFGNFIRKGQLIEFYIILAPAVNLVFSDNKKINYGVLIVSLICFTVPNYYLNNYPDINFFNPALICLFILFFILINYFKNENLKAEKLLRLERDKVLVDKIILEEQKSKLKELSDFKSHFFGNLSHEIRTPLTLIQGHASRIDLKEDSSQNQKKINIINNQISQIHTIIDNVLDLSKIDTNEFVINTKPVSIIPFINKQYTKFKELFEEKEIHFEISLSFPDIYIEIDEDLMLKSINNLLSNSLKFTPKKGFVNLTVTLEDDLTISVQDNGIGVLEQDIQRVFDRFDQSKNDITKSQGSGIGLSFTKSILDAHNFKISLSSIPNKSTIFTIHIPKKAINKVITSTTAELESNLKIKPKELEKIEKRSQRNTNKKRILIVEDNKEVRSYLKTVLIGYETIEAENGQEALNLLKNHNIDLIITDYMMPILDGKGLVSELKKQEIKTPIIVLTARIDNTGRLNMLRLGIDGYLIKPFIEEELLLMIQKSLSSVNTIIAFETTLEQSEKESLNAFANKFNIELNDYINANLKSANFGVEDIALYLNISKSTLNRKTKTILGQTTQEIIMEARLQKAKKLLYENPHATKKEIAEAVGVTNTTYFFNKINKPIEISF